jgi:undecaprenyl-diphosphatase
MNALESLNRAVFLQWNAAPSAAGWKLAFAAAIADDLIYLVPVVLVAMWCWGGQQQRQAALKVCAVALVALGINQLLAIGFPHPRPSEIGLGHTFIQHAADSSFPSDHATVFAALGLTLVFAGVRPVLGWTVLFLGAWVAWARIYLGVHYPLDMAGALGVVAVVCLAIGAPWNRLGPYLVTWVERRYHLILAKPISLGWIRR